MHVRFKARSPISVLGGRAAAVSFNGRTYHDLLLTTVNMSPVLNGPPAMDSVLRIDVPADLILIAEEVVKLPARELLCYLDETSSFVYRREYTQALVRDHFAGSQQDSAQRLQVSLICPLSQKKIVVPCRGVRCRRVQCFEAYAYLVCSEDTQVPPWRCPFCSSLMFMPDICVDLLTLYVFREADYLCVAVVFRPDAS
ncbi:E3 SUMO-protein ligase PIAS2-like [Amblyomma americanum]